MKNVGFYSELPRQCAHGHHALCQCRYGISDERFEIEGPFSDNGVVPLINGIKDKVFVMDAINLSGNILCPFHRIALTGTDLHGPDRVNIQTDCGSARAMAR